jgi:putative heme-binding domain-containing protein
MNRFIFLLAMLFPGVVFAAAPTKPFELRDGDRVVFVGDTLIEREQHYGYVELMMTLRWPERNVTFRNLGWSADTPVGQSRVSFDWNKGEAEWFKQLVEQIKQTQPTVVVLGYGMASSLEDAAQTELERQSGTKTSGGTARLDKFAGDYEKLIDAILELNKETRFILLSPIRHEKLPAPLPDPTRHNEFLANYTKAIQGVAEKRGYHFVNLYDWFDTIHDPSVPQTENGIHLHKQGYAIAARLIAGDLGWQDMVDAQINVNSPPTLSSHEDLRHAIIKKNRTFFHRWRPQNSTYLFLFRKHEQGKNAQEIPQFDPLVAAEEEKIAKLRREPAKQTPPQAFAHKPKQNPLPEKPQTPFRPQPKPEFTLADPNLEISLWAENPLLAKPIQMNWDARGRLFVASSSAYPQIAPGQEEEDKILIIEDTNGDGKADKTTVFADGLLIPSAVEPGDGGAYVGQSTELLHFKDNDGDGIADERRVVLSGFGTEDTHHTLHTLRWGPDGQLNMNQSIYIHSHIETPHGVVRLNSGGTLQLRPDTLELGVLMKGLVNGWGHAIDDFGQSFQTDGAGGAGINWIVPQAMYVTYAGARRILGSVSPGSYPKFCGLEIIKSEHFPKDWQGGFVTCDFRANRLVRFSIEESGAAYVTKQHEFLRTTNITFRPIDVKLGPDGALYIADWSNPIIQHGEVDFRDPRRDREHGRIWRVSYKGGRKVEKPELVKAENNKLLEELLSPNGFNEKQARRLLAERFQKGTEQEMRSLRLNLSAFETRYGGVNSASAETVNDAMLEALWLHQAIDWHQFAGAKNFVGRLLFNDDYRVRAAAVRVLAAWMGNTPGIPSLASARVQPTTDMQVSDPALNALDLLARAISDKHPRVRLEALRALARIPTARSAELALSVLDKGAVEGHLEYALWLTINDLAEPWAAAVESGAWKIEGREKQLQYALKSIEPQLATRLMAKVIGDKPLPRDGSGGMIELIGQAGGPAQLRQLFDQVLSGGFTDGATARALRSLGEAARLRNAKPTGNLNDLRQLIDSALNAMSLPIEVDGRRVESSRMPVALESVKLAGTWKLAGLAPTLSKRASDTNATALLRQASIDGLRDLGGRDSITALRSLAKDQDSSIQRAAAAALATADLNGSMPQILEVVSGTTKENDALALWRSLLATKGASSALTKALATNSLPETAAKAGLRAAREGGRNEPNLIMALNKAGSISDPSAALTDEEIHAISYEVTKGNPANGEKIYRRKELGCVLCHSIGGAGGKVGPDMTSLGASTPLVNYIVESVLLPNKKVKEGFNSVQITLKDGDEVTGNLVREDNEQVILRDATAREVSVPKRDIQSRKMGGSIMPAGLVDYITPQERLDLYAFLKELGKPGPYDATKQNVARVWRLNSKVGTVNADEMLKTDVRTGKDWTPLFSLVNGTLPKADVLAELEGKDSTVWLASRLQTSKAGPVTFKVTGTPSPKAWVNGKPIGGAGDLTTEVPAGQHTFFLKVTTSDIASGIRVESNDATFLTE